MLREGLEREGVEGSEVTALSQHWDFAAGEVGGGEGAFFATCEDGDDAAEGWGGGYEGEEVVDEARAGVVDQ